MSIVSSITWRTTSYLFARHLSCRQYECDNLTPDKYFVKCVLECSTELGRPREHFYLGPYDNLSEAKSAHTKVLEMMKEEKYILENML